MRTARALMKSKRRQRRWWWGEEQPPPSGEFERTKEGESAGLKSRGCGARERV